MTGPSAAEQLRGATQAVWGRVRHIAQNQVAEVESAVIALLEGRLTDQDRSAAERQAHKLAGSAGTFGFARASELARELELLFANAGAGPVDVVRAAELVESLGAEIGAETPTGPPPQSATIEPDGKSAALLLYVGTDDRTGLAMVGAAGIRGVHVALAVDPATARDVLARGRPSVAVVDLHTGTADTRTSLLHALDAAAVPVLVTGAESNTRDRLVVARAGVRAFLDSGQPANAVVDAALALLDDPTVGNTKVLAVDDDPLVLEAVRAVLPAVIDVVPLQDPALFWETLTETGPDLILLDIDMPGMNGLELCQLLRSDARWRTVPVVFLSARTDAVTVTRVYAAGADDFVHKPIVGPELMTRVRNRLERSRLQRLLAETDPLTGLANRRKIEDQVSRLQRLSDRYGTVFSVAVLDLDRFKRVNDRHGHAVGDLVLQRLALHLVAAFRGADVVGRLGGEEFIVALFGMSRDDAVARLSEVLEAFRDGGVELPDGARLTIGASAGVSQYPDDATTFRGLYRVADAALTKAKRAGRGRTLAAGSDPPADENVVDLLIVEDDPVVVELLRDTFRTAGFRCAVISDGAEALHRLTATSQRLTASVILLDLDLPGLSGFEILHGLTSAGVVPGTTIIVVSARASETEAVRAVAAGASDHVGKPFSLPLLVQKVRRALSEAGR